MFIARNSTLVDPPLLGLPLPRPVSTDFAGILAPNLDTPSHIESTPIIHLSPHERGALGHHMPPRAIWHLSPHGAHARTLALTQSTRPTSMTSHLCLRAAPRPLGISDATQSYIGAPPTPLVLSHSVHLHRAALNARQVHSTKNLPQLHLSPSGESHHVILICMHPLTP